MLTVCCWPCAGRVLTGGHKGELSFKKNDVIVVTGYVNPSWYISDI